MITPEQHAEIRRLYYGEHWKVGTIAAALGVHHETVRAALVNHASRRAWIPTSLSSATRWRSIRGCARRGSSTW
jgi:DNA-binding transcriptional regulator LsrR (DeoR family)